MSKLRGVHCKHKKEYTCAHWGGNCWVCEKCKKVKGCGGKRREWHTEEKNPKFNSDYNDFYW